MKRNKNARSGSELQELLAIAAEMRTEGTGWEAIAKKVHRSVDTVRRWPQRYTRDWQRRFRETEERLVAEASAEGVFVLRKMLRDDDVKVQRDVARALVSARTARRRQDSNATPEPPTDRERIAAFLSKCDEGELRRLLEELLLHAGRNQSN